MGNTVQSLPPKMAMQFAERAKRGEGHRVSPKDEIYEFPQGNNIVCIMALDPAMGYLKKDPLRAAQLRALATQK